MQLSYLVKTPRMLIAVVLLALTLSGCTTIDPYTGERTTSKTAVGAGIGAIGGALIGAATGGGRGALIGAAAGGAVGAVAGNVMDRQDQELRRVLRGTGVRVIRTRHRISLVMSSDVTFARNSANINASFYPTLHSVARVLRHFNKTNIVISGYTSATGTAAYNQVLSEKRAFSVGAYLRGQGISRRRVFTQGFGLRYPVASNKTEKGRRLNRRVVINLRPMAG